MLTSLAHIDVGAAGQVFDGAARDVLSCQACLDQQARALGLGLEPLINTEGADRGVDTEITHGLRHGRPDAALTNAIFDDDDK